MQLNTLKPAEGSVKSRKRLGRGNSSGKGGTSTKGTKGNQSRAGYKAKVGFEGGQMPIQRRVPKRGFKNVNRVEYTVFNLGNVDGIMKAYELPEFSFELLYQIGVVSKDAKVKILGTGELEAGVKFTVHAVSKSAKEAIEKTGGSITILP